MLIIHFYFRTTALLIRYFMKLIINVRHHVHLLLLLNLYLLHLLKTFILQTVHLYIFIFMAIINIYLSDFLRNRLHRNQNYDILNFSHILLMELMLIISFSLFPIILYLYNLIMLYFVDFFDNFRQRNSFFYIWILNFFSILKYLLFNYESMQNYGKYQQ